MSVVRAQIDLGGNNVQAQPVGASLLAQRFLTQDATLTPITLNVLYLLGGILERSGPTGTFIDTFPDGIVVLSAQPELSANDNFEFTYRNLTGQLMNPASGEGVVLSGINNSVAATTWRDYLITILASGIRQAFGAQANNTSTLTGIPLANLAKLQVGQGIIATGIGTTNSIVSINYANASLTLTSTVPSTGLVAVTTFPRYQVQGIRSGTL